MLQLAREKHPHPKVEYKRLDIANDKDVARFSAEEGCFEIVYSFAAFHWIPDQHQAIRNIEKLMVPAENVSFRLEEVRLCSTFSLLWWHLRAGQSMLR
ncbi:hypothetical protein HPB48_000096 [Haemaphysalis longicornis]|uniref:Methyltransferase type 11 domain-containing protein n=1 Tax=Haemaphysalis longicornis TaxID=44386 RepID=A0A9J6GZ85_HAELO|nr:hypothetical protein HPB48_000096 [Haemaphysalis longicornis]